MPALRRVRLLIALTAVATVVVDVVNLHYAREAGFGLFVRTFWAVLRALGFLFLLREVRLGRLSARPLSLILGATTVFAVARLVQPRDRQFLPPWQVLTGLLILVALCGTVTFQLYRSPALAAHLTRRPPRRPVPVWALTARVCALSFSALMLVPCLVAAGSLVHHPRLSRTVEGPIVVGWFVLSFGLAFVTAVVSFLVLFDKSWARTGLAMISGFLLVVQPTLCWFLGGWDSLLRDGAPMVVTTVLCLTSLHRAHRASVPSTSA